MIRSNDAYAWTGATNVDRPDNVNGLNQITQTGTTALGYDARGNLTSLGGTSYGYSAENQLISSNLGLLYFHDGAGRLAVQYTPNDATAFLYDGGQIATEHDKLTLATLRRYVWGADVDEPLVWYEGSGTSDKRYLHADERGSVIAVSNASGTVTNINSYDDYGIPAAGNVGRFQYTGQAWLPELGMYYYKARIYSPTLGRFLQTDPIGYGDGLNWYNYVGGDPVNFRDPSGQTLLCFTRREEGYSYYDSTGMLIVVVAINIRECVNVDTIEEPSIDLVLNIPSDRDIDYSGVICVGEFCSESPKRERDNRCKFGRFLEDSFGGSKPVNMTVAAITLRSAAKFKIAAAVSGPLGDALGLGILYGGALDLANCK